jgi:hypothetical protein
MVAKANLVLTVVCAMRRISLDVFSVTLLNLSQFGRSGYVI